jgi:hypothetical protein
MRDVLKKSADKNGRELLISDVLNRGVTWNG